MQNTEAIGAVVRQRRRELELTQLTLAQFAGCSARFLHDLEHGKERISLDKLFDVLDVLGLEIDVVRRQPVAR